MHLRSCPLLRSGAAHTLFSPRCRSLSRPLGSSPAPDLTAGDPGDDTAAAAVLDIITTSPSGEAMANSHRESAIFVSNDLIDRVLKRVRFSHSDPLRALEFFSYTGRRKGFFHTQVSPDTMIYVLGRGRKFEEVRKVLKETSRKDPFLVTTRTMQVVLGRVAKVCSVKQTVQSFRRFKKLLREFDTSCFNAMLRTLRREKSMADTRNVYHSLKRDFRPDLHTFNILLSGWKSSEEAEGFWGEVKELGVKPDVVPYNGLVDVYCKNMQVEKAYQLVENMRNDDIRPDVFTYTSIIGGLGLIGKPDKAKDVLKEMKEWGCHPDVAAYNEAIRNYCIPIRLRDAFVLMDEMEAKGLSPNPTSYNLFFRHFYWSNELGSAWGLYQRMRDHGCLLNTQSCMFRSLPNGVASCCLKSVSERMLPRANVVSDSFLYGRCSRHLPPSRVGFHRSLHGLVKTEFLVEGIDDNISSNIKQISEDVEKVCRILSKEPNLSVGSSLDQSGVEVSVGFVVEVLKKLSNAGTLALSFFRWVEKQQGFKHLTECYHHLIEALGKIKQFKLIWNLVDVMKDRQILTKETFALISRRYVRTKRINEAVETFEKMRNFGLKPDISDFNRLLDTLSKSKNVRVAQEIFVNMRRRNQFSPDLKTYTILLEGWGNMMDLARLTGVFQEMMSDGFEPDIVTYGILIHGFVKCRKVDEAIKIFHGMRERNLKPSPHIYCILINELGAEKRLPEALKYFELSKANGLALDIPMYNAVVGAYCRVQQFENAYTILAEMKNSGIGPNARTYEVILHHLIKACRIEEAYLVFQRMARESDCEPELNTYTIIVRMFCVEERLDMALKVWQQMSEKGIIPCMHMYSVLINGLLCGRRLEEACEYFQEMLDRGLRPPGLLYCNLKKALIDGGKEDLAMLMGTKLEKVRRTPLIG